MRGCSALLPPALPLTHGCGADLESVFYVLTELVMGEQLPWSLKEANSDSDSDDDESTQFTVSFKRANPRTCSSLNPQAD